MKVTLLDGEHDLRPPNFLTLDMMDQMKGHTPFTEDDFTARISIQLAAMLTDAEPIVNDEPARTWKPIEAARLIPAESALVIDALTQLLLEAFPEAKGTGDKTDRPTKAGSKSR